MSSSLTMTNSHTHDVAAGSAVHMIARVQQRVTHDVNFKFVKFKTFDFYLTLCVIKNVQVKKKHNPSCMFHLT